MQEVDVDEVERKFDDYLKKVAGGATFILTKRGTPIARFGPPQNGDDLYHGTVLAIEPI